MKKLLTLLPALLLLFAFQSTTQAQTAEEIVANYLETIGGEENLKAIKNMKITMNGKAQGMDFPMTMYQAAPNKLRMDFTFQGQTMTQMAFDGETAWGVNFMNQKTEKKSKEESEIAKQEADFPNPFVDYKAKGFTISLEGEETIDGTDCHKLKLTKKPLVIDGEEEDNFAYYFFDKETNVPIMTRSYAMTGPQKGAESETYYSDYQEVDGIYFAFSQASKFQGQTAFSSEIEKIEINVSDIDDNMFVFPEDRKSPQQLLEEAAKSSKDKGDKAIKDGKKKKKEKKKKK